MLKKILTATLLTLSSYSFAGLESLDNTDLASIDGQAGADLSLLLSLNQVKDSTTGNYVPISTCSTTGTTFEQCRLGISFNNRYDNGEYVDRAGKRYNAAGTEIAVANAQGKKLWIVLKGLQGTIDLQHVGLDGTDLIYNDKSNNQIIKPAIQLSYDAAKPIKIRNYGFDALSMEVDSHADTPANSTLNTPGYLNKGTGGTGTNAFADGKYTNTTNKFDLGRETGFIGMKMHGNLALQGTVKIFGCDGSHPRC